MMALPWWWPAWWDASVCGPIEDSERIYFSANSKDVRRAKALCAVCPVWEECLRSAAESDGSWRYGIWAGLTEQDRDELWKDGRPDIEGALALVRERRAA